MDFFADGGMFVYYSVEQARHVARGGTTFRGPDFFFVDRVPERPPQERGAWVSWQEGGRLPDLIVELLSPSTAENDRNEKKQIYARTFRTPEYYLYDMDTKGLEAFRLAGDAYRPVRTDSRGRFPSEVLGLDLGLWRGAWKDRDVTWLRLYYPDGRLVPTAEEAANQRAEAERQRAETASRQAESDRQRAEEEHRRADSERQRAEAAEARAAEAEAELKRLRGLLGGG